MNQNLVKDALLSTSSNGLCKVYRGRYYHWPCVIKELSYQTPDSLSKVISEISAQQALSHEKICKIYNYFYDTTTLTAVIVLEPLDSDMEKEISQRAETNMHWDESSIWWYLGWLVSALAYAQEKGVAHRDICPGNIFLTTDKDVKIGDFGSAKILSSSITSTICMPQIPYFASPELKRQLLGSSSASSLEYNPFQSDVYSLGLTVLNMILLEKSMELIELDRLESVTSAIIEGLLVSEGLKSVLREMLRVENRFDFLQLLNFLTSAFQPPQPVAENCGTDTGDVEIDLETLASMLSISELQREALEIVFSNPITCSFSLEMKRICQICDKEFLVDLRNIHDEFESYFCSPVCMEKCKVEEKKIQPKYERNCSSHNSVQVEIMRKRLNKAQKVSMKPKGGALRGNIVDAKRRAEKSRRDYTACYRPSEARNRK